ncbi:MAG: sensor histidine kinase [Chthoniobacteraceae bacterium]
MTEIATLRALTRDQADERRPMRLHGVVTYYERAKYMAFIQDATGGTYVTSEWKVVEPPDFSGPIHAGLLVEVDGVTDGGRFAPFLWAGKDRAPMPVRILSEAPMPTPLRPVRGELLDPKFHSQWVEVEAFARDLRIDRKRLTITLVFGGRRFEAHIPGEWKADALPAIADSDVRVRGVFGSIFNEQRQLIGVQLFVPSLDQIEVLDAGLARAFKQSARAVREIMQFNPGTAERMRVQGTVTFHEPGRGFFLRDASGAVWVENDDATALAPGTSVDAVGFATIEHLSPVVRDAVVRVGERGPPPEPVALDAAFGLDASLHGQLVRVEAQVVDRLILPHNHTLALQSGETFFNARFAGEEGRVELPPRGAWVAVTGICQNIFRGEAGRDAKGDDARQPVAFNVLMRGKSDLAVLRTPPWWTTERLIYLAAGLGVIVAAALAWAAMLRRRVEQQSAIIAEKVSHERIAEERTRIARELHDTLEQHLAGVAIQLDAAAARLPDAPGAANDALTLGAAMLRHSRTEARRSVWDLRSQLLEQHGLPQTLRDLAASMSTDACRIGVEIEGAEGRLDPQVEFHLLRIAQEALANALKHSRATRITLTLRFGPEATQLTVADEGIGFDPAVNGANCGAHFGLLGMRERTAKVRGTLQVESTPGSGTRVHISVPG